MYGVLDLTWVPSARSTAPAAGQADAIVRGDTYPLPLAFWEDPEAETGPIAITGTVKAQIRRARLGKPVEDVPTEAPLAEFAVTVSGAGNNIVTISLTPAQTLALPSGTLYWDLQSDDSGVVTTWLAGQAKVVDDVTRVSA